jgi:hypothetical protein
MDLSIIAAAIIISLFPFINKISVGGNSIEFKGEENRTEVIQKAGKE